MPDGFIKLARCLLDKPVLQNANLLQVWIWCLLKATHKEREQLIGLRKVQLEPGQFVTGRFKGASELKMKPSTFRNCLEWLKENQSITIKVDTKFSLISVVNWQVYQVEMFGDGQQKDSKRTAKGQQLDTNKNDKNVKNDKNDKKNNYSEFVKLTTEEYDRLLTEFGKVGVDRLIEILDNYKGANGKKYADDNRAIRNWVIKRYQEEQPKQSQLSYMEQEKIKRKKVMDELARRNGRQDAGQGISQLPELQR